MAPKRKAKETEEPFYDKSGYFLCQPQNDFLVTVGINLNDRKKPVRVRVGESAAEAVERWLQENEEKVLQMRAGAGDHPQVQQDRGGGLFVATEDLLDEVESVVLASKRARKEPDRYVVDNRGLRQRGSGERYNRKQDEDAACGTCRCKRQECQALLAEQEWLYGVLRSVKELWEQMRQLAHEAAHGDTEKELGVAALQQAMLDILDDAERHQGSESIGKGCPEDTEQRKSEENITGDAADHGACRLRATLQSARGELVLQTGNDELIWMAAEGQRERRLPLHTVRKVSASIVRINPFQRVSRITIDLKSGAHAVEFDSGEGEEQTSQFVTELTQLIMALSSASRPQQCSAAHQAPASGAAASSVESLTSRVKVGRELRAKLIEVMRMRNRHRATEADRVMDSLAVDSSDAAERARRSGLTKRRASDLRNELFSYGGLQLTRDVIQHFLNMPEVRELLGRAHGKSSGDAAINELIVKAAHDFLATVFKANGRRSGTGGRLDDESRNAHMVALTALLPSDLFANRRGRAACRALGISYAQAKRGTSLRGEILADSCRGWKRLKTSEHYDKVDYRAFLDEAWHSELLSTPDNQNKQRIRVDLGVDPKTGDHLYDIHDRRAQLASTKELLHVFRNSEFAGKMRDATKSARRPQGVKVGIKQFTEARCPCIKKRKPSQCDCQLCTYISENLYKLNLARANWHAAYKRETGHGCLCHIHQPLSLSQLAAADLEKAWHEACAAGGEERTDLGEAFETAMARASELKCSVERANAYDTMAKSPARLMATMLPCGQTEYPDYSVTGASTYTAYSHNCAQGNCPKKLWRGSQACSFEALFRSGCPIDADGTKNFAWRAWEQRPRGKNRETGEISYSPEFVPRNGTRLQFWSEFKPSVATWLYHVWRDDFLKQSLRVFEDRKSGRYLDACRKGVNEVASPHEQAAAAKKLQQAQEMFDMLQKTATIQSDYAAQLEVVRSHTATCARTEKHNFLVTIVGYKSYKEAANPTIRRLRKPSQPSQRVSSTEVLVHRQQRNCARMQGSAKRRDAPSPARLPVMQPQAQTIAHDPDSGDVYKQHVDYIFAFHEPSYKPNARSYNVVQEDVDHFLKYGTVLHGEWFINKARVPLREGSHQMQLPDGLTERDKLPPEFPEMQRRHSLHDGCASQFACGTEFHQTAEWLTKTAEWNQSATQQDGIIRDDVKLVEHHGKGAYDAAGNIPNRGVRASVTAGRALQPGTRELVLHLASFYPTPAVAKSNKSGWLAATRYIYCFYYTSKFTRFSVPPSKGFPGSHSHHHFVGLCSDRSKAEQDGPLHARRMFCACYSCIMLRFNQCVMVEQVGAMKMHKCPLISSSQLRKPQSRSLEEFADELCEGMVVAVRVARDERGLELGRPYWLARVLGPAFAAPTEMLHAGIEIEEGWLVVEMQWYELHDEERHAYKLNTSKRLLNVNAIARLSGIKFEVGAGPRVALRSGSGQGQLHFLSEDMHYAILCGLGED